MMYRVEVVFSKKYTDALVRDHKVKTEVLRHGRLHMSRTDCEIIELMDLMFPLMRGLSCGGLTHINIESYQ